MYAIVQFGDKEEKVYNLNCKCLQLLHCLRDNSQLSEEVSLDLSDEEGNVKLLHDNLDRYASELLKERERLVLLRVERTTKEERLKQFIKKVRQILLKVNAIGDYTYTPLLKNEMIVNGSYMARLARKLTSGRPRISKTQVLVSGQRSSKGARQLSPEQSSVRTQKTLNFSGATNQLSQKIVRSFSIGQQVSRQRLKSRQGP